MGVKIDVYGYFVDEIAQVCHEAVRALQRIYGEQVNFPWENLNKEMRDSVQEGVTGVMNGNTPEQSHQSWCANRVANGWVYGEVKDFAKKTHPNLVPYEDLSDGQKMKDKLFTAIVNAMTTDD